jgi:hypothetical protein
LGGGKEEIGEGNLEGRSPSYKLNIIDRFTNKLIPLVILSVKITSLYILDFF